MGNDKSNVSVQVLYMSSLSLECECPGVVHVILEPRTCASKLCSCYAEHPFVSS